MRASAWDKFLLLSWKNWIIQFRHPIQTFFEVLIPIFICALLLLVKALVRIDKFGEKRYAPIPANTTFGFESLLTDFNNSGLIYSPKNPVYQRIVDNVSEQFGFTRPVVGLPNSLELLETAMVSQPFASIEFEDSLQVSVDGQFY